MLLARIHNVGAAKAAPNRIELNPSTYGIQNLEYLLSKWIPIEFRAKYEAAVRGICTLVEPWFKELPPETDSSRSRRLSLGNLLWNQEGPFFLDFDDMVRAPAAQDIWLLTPGRDQETKYARESLLEGYTDFRAFDRSTLQVDRASRALRFVHYTAWVARRWEDPAFPAAFPEFGFPSLLGRRNSTISRSSFG